MIRRGYSLIVTEMFDEVLFRDHVGRPNHWVLVGAVLLVDIFNQNSTPSRTRGVERQRMIGDVTS
jgi:hypothetical protein